MGWQFPNAKFADKIQLKSILKKFHELGPDLSISASQSWVSLVSSRMLDVVVMVKVELSDQLLGKCHPSDTIPHTFQSRRPQT